jgi:hypothetical protein
VKELALAQTYITESVDASVERPVAKGEALRTNLNSPNNRIDPVDAAGLPRSD